MVAYQQYKVASIRSSVGHVTYIRCEGRVQPQSLPQPGVAVPGVTPGPQPPGTHLGGRDRHPPF